MRAAGGVDGGGVVAGAAQMGELSQQLSAAQEAVVVDQEGGVNASCLVEEDGGSVSGSVHDSGSLTAVLMRVDGGAIFVLGGDVQVLDAPFAHGVAVFVKEDFSDAHRRNLHGDGSAATQASTVQGQALGQGDGLGYGAWVFCDVFCIHRSLPVGCRLLGG